MKIGIYDSGIGGLSVLHRALKKMPEAEFIYYADTKHVPYLSLIHISEPTRLGMISYAVFCLKKKKNTANIHTYDF